MSGSSTDITGRILLEDNHLLIVNKLPSEIVQGDKTGDTPLSEHIKLYIKNKYNKPGDVFLGVIHRLDRPVSGVVAFARTSKALARMNEMQRERKLGKKYWAVVAQAPPAASGTLVHYLKKNEERNTSRAFPAETAGSLRAELDYALLAASDRYFLLAIDLRTGRHHQIRAQLAAVGCPVRGDVKYGYPRPNDDASIHLHARSLSFIHPVSREDCRILADPPRDPLWDYFLQLNPPTQ